MKHRERLIGLLALGVMVLAACTGAMPATSTDATSVPTAASAASATTEAAAVAPATTGDVPADVNLDAVKDYTLDHAQQMKTGTAALAVSAQAYYDLMATHNFDYAAAWAAEPELLTQQVGALKEHWLEASTHYELDEGIIAGVPSLAFYDVWIDAGPSAAEDPEGAYQWTLELPDGRTLESPGNFFHSLLEPIIWGTVPDFVGLATDIDGDGTTELGESLPEANVLLATAKGLDGATDEMITAVQAWQPSMSDAFTALVVMIPTMSEYFEQWKLSSYIAGERSTESAFIGVSRLFDINGILNGLDFTYQNISPVVATTDPELHNQITAGFADLRGYVGNLYQQELDGKVFTAEQADLFGTEAQNLAAALAGQVSQAAALLNVEVAE